MLRRLAETAKRFIDRLSEAIPMISSPSRLEPMPKRGAEEDVKKRRTEKTRRYAMLLGYNGKRYYGMQFQREDHFPTIESTVLKALWKAGTIDEEHYQSPGSIQLMRAARTDRGVSAARQLCSVLLPTTSDFVQGATDGVNAYLPDDIRVFGVRRVTPSFHAQKNCDSRTYSYTLPTFAFAELDQLANEHYRITPERVRQVDELLRQFVGTHNFFNYTARKEFIDRHCRRYIISLSCDEPFLYRQKSEGGREMEFLTIQCRGQSFMMHQIRKIIGTAIAIMRGLMGMDDFKRSFTSERMDIPKAPGNGLMLERLHYDLYELRFCGEKKVHESMNSWGEEVTANVDKFRREVIFEQMLADEINEGSMMSWLQSLQNACLFYRRDGEQFEEGNFTIKSAVARAVIKSFEITPSEVRIENQAAEEEGARGSTAAHNYDDENEAEWTGAQDDHERIFDDEREPDNAEECEAATCPPASRLAEKR